MSEDEMTKAISWNVPFQTPIVNHHFGFRFLDPDFEGRVHPGEDFNGPGYGDADSGMDIKPIGPGEVSFIDNTGANGGWGNMMYTKHDMVKYFNTFGLPKPDWCPDTVWALYAHLKDIQVVEGQKVGVDTVIAHMGGTPYLPNGKYKWSSHLHAEVRKMPLGVYFYPNKTVTKEWVKEHYFPMTQFVMEVNAYVQSFVDQTPDSNLLKAEGAPEIYVFNKKTLFHIPDEETAILLFGPDWIKGVETVSKKVLDKYPLGAPLPSMRV